MFFTVFSNPIGCLVIRGWLHMNLLTRSALTSHALTSLTMAKLAETATGRRGLNRHLLFKGSYHSVNISR